MLIPMQALRQRPPGPDVLLPAHVLRLSNVLFPARMHSSLPRFPHPVELFSWPSTISEKKPVTMIFCLFFDCDFVRSGLEKLDLMKPPQCNQHIRQRCM